MDGTGLEWSCVGPFKLVRDLSMVLAFLGGISGEFLKGVEGSV